MGTCLKAAQAVDNIAFVTPQDSRFLRKVVHGDNTAGASEVLEETTMSHEVLRDPRIAQLHRLKPVVATPGPGDLVRLPLVRKAFIYQRLSTHEQRKKSLWSLEMQDALLQQAKADGYREDQIIVERRDLGISGTKGRDKRPGLAALIQTIEADEVEAVYVVHISRISRDQTLIDGLEFGNSANSTASSSSCPPCG